MSEFHFVAARITAAQICRSAGIERSSASVLDALTSIMLDFLTMLGNAAASAMEARDAHQANISDAVLASVQCGVVRGPLMGDITSQRDIDELMQWIRGPIQQRMTELARPQRTLNAQYSVNVVNNTPGSVADSNTNAAFNMTKNTTNQPTQASSISQVASSSSDPVAVDSLTDLAGNSSSASQELSTTTSNDWLRAVISRQSAMGHKDFNEALASRHEPDTVIHGL